MSTKVIDVKGGDKVGVMWGHVIGGAQFANDKDNPIAASHKGPTIFYMAKVDDAAKADGKGLKWFKVGVIRVQPSYERHPLTVLPHCR